MRAAANEAICPIKEPRCGAAIRRRQNETPGATRIDLLPFARDRSYCGRAYFDGVLFGAGFDESGSGVRVKRWLTMGLRSWPSQSS